jgi:hypothetical protein
MGATNNILGRTMQAVVAFLEAQELPPGVSVFAGISQGQGPISENENRVPLPSVVVNCDSATHDPEAHATGTWQTSVEIRVRSNADDTTETEHLERAGAVFDLFMCRGIHELLTLAAPDFTCFQVLVKTQRYDLTGRSWQSILELDAAVCGSDITIT